MSIKEAPITTIGHQQTEIGAAAAASGPLSGKTSSNEVVSPGLNIGTQQEQMGAAAQGQRATKTQSSVSVSA